MATLLNLLLVFNAIYGQDLVAPNCNYAATESQFFPIGACSTSKTINPQTKEISYSASKYVCYGNNQVYLLTYGGPEYCQGNPISPPQSVTNQLNGYECDKGPCPFAELCARSGCESSGDCTECELNPDNYDKQCTPKITNNCFGQTNVFKNDECANKMLTENVYIDESGGGFDCSSDPVYTQTLGGDNPSTNCVYGKYYTTTCNIEQLVPNCNYAETGHTYVPIGVCDKKKTLIVDENGKIRKDEIEYYAFKYVCNGENVLKYEYNSIRYCAGVAFKQTVVNQELQSFECDKSQCEYADRCSQTGCVEIDSEGTPDCSKCANLKQLSKSFRKQRKYSLECLPTITNQCVGFKGEMTNQAQCQSNTNDRKNDLLIESFYFSGDCVNYAFSFDDTIGGTDPEVNCKVSSDGIGSYSTVSCEPDNQAMLQAFGENIIDDNINHKFNFNDYFSGVNTMPLVWVSINAVIIFICVFVCCRYVICGGCNKKYNSQYSKTEQFDDDEAQALQ